MDPHLYYMMTLNPLTQRIMIAKNLGGISLFDVKKLDESIVPNDWVLDIMTQYYIPPNIIIFPPYKSKIGVGDYNWP